MKFTTNFVLAAVSVALVIGSTITANATFPGKNGRIAFLLGPDIYSMNSDATDLPANNPSGHRSRSELGILVARCITIGTLNRSQSLVSTPDLFLPKSHVSFTQHSAPIQFDPI